MVKAGQKTRDRSPWKSIVLGEFGLFTQHRESNIDFFLESYLHKEKGPTGKSPDYTFNLKQFLLI